jgi:hypothetical protein
MQLLQFDQQRAARRQHGVAVNAAFLQNFDGFQ